MGLSGGGFTPGQFNFPGQNTAAANAAGSTAGAKKAKEAEKKEKSSAKGKAKQKDADPGQMFVSGGFEAEALQNELNAEAVMRNFDEVAGQTAQDMGEEIEDIAGGLEAASEGLQMVASQAAADESLGTPEIDNSKV